MSSKKIKPLIKTLCMFLIYIFYTGLASKILSLVGVSDDIFIMFIADILFFFIIVLVYKDNLKKDFKGFINNYDLKQKIWVIAKYVVLIFALNIVMGFLTEIFIPGASNSQDENALSISSLFEISTFYTLFKTLIFATIAEELLFRESIRECIDNKVAFALLSALIYSTMNIIYTDLSISYVWMDFIAYFSTYMLLSHAYLKNNNNIVIIILIKFFYNLIPTLILLLGVI